MVDDLARDAFEYVNVIMPLIAVIGGISIADLSTNFFINLVKKAKIGGGKSRRGEW